MKSAVRAVRKGLRGSTVRKYGIRNKEGPMKAMAGRAGKTARNHADYLFYKQTIVHSYRLCFYRLAVMAIGKFVLQLYSK